MNSEIDAFFASWEEDEPGMKKAALACWALLRSLPDSKVEFKARPGVSYSLRACHNKAGSRPLFVLVDIIDDDEENRWLSVCFYDDYVRDPDHLGDQVPGGLLGEDARCFDLDDPDASPAYILARLKEAHATAAAV